MQIQTGGDVLNRFYAICPFCSKSIFVEENLSGGYSCPQCGQALGLPYLQEHDLIIDVAAADEQYKLAQQYFANTDFLAAGEHFVRVLKYNRNNYLADYYARLCDIYENEGKAEYNLPEKIIEAIISSIEKLMLSQVSIAARIEFINSVLSQAYILLSSHFNNIFEQYEKREMWDMLRDKSLNIASCVQSLINIDKEKLMVFDSSVSKSLISIADLAICACQKVVQPHLGEGDKLILPTDYEYEKAKKLYSVFFYYATSLDPNYSFSSYKPDYTGNLLYNENVLTQLSRYNTANKQNNKKFLSDPNAGLDKVRESCQVAIKYSYYTCFKGLSVPKNDPSRQALIGESIGFCIETLMPRISIAEEKKVSIDVKKFGSACDTAFYLSEFLSDCADGNKRAAAEYMNRFYKRLLEMTKLYFSVVYNSYNKFVNKLKESQNREFRYYRNFLYQVVCCCALALKECIAFDQHNLGDRIKLLKLGKQVTEEFLLLSDYKIDELEQSAKYSDILDVFNAFDSSLAALGGK